MSTDDLLQRCEDCGHVWELETLEDDNTCPNCPLQCDECGALIPDTDASVISESHLTSCSCHPANGVSETRTRSTLVYRVTSTTHRTGDLREDLTLAQAHTYATELVEGGFSPVIHSYYTSDWQEITWSELCTLASGE